jgi:hypothetical protein
LVLNTELLKKTDLRSPLSGDIAINTPATTTRRRLLTFTPFKNTLLINDVIRRRPLTATTIV